MFLVLPLDFNTRFYECFYLVVKGCLKLKIQCGIKITLFTTNPIFLALNKCHGISCIICWTNASVALSWIKTISKTRERWESSSYDQLICEKKTWNTRSCTLYLLLTFKSKAKNDNFDRN